MNQPDGLTPEMDHYITTGTCPHCGVAILSPDYVRRKRAAMYAQIGKYLKYGPVLLNLWIGFVGDILTPAGTKVEHFGYDQLQCMTCTLTWTFYPLDLSPDVQQAPQDTRSALRRPTRPLYQDPGARVSAKSRRAVI